MRSLLITTAVLFVFSQASAFDLGKFSESVIKSKSEKLTASVQPSSTIGGCTDFSGTWQGQCTLSTPEGDETSTESIAIAQTDCSSITMNGEYMGIGGIQSRQDNGYFYANVFHNVVDWDGTAKSLVMNGAGLFKVTVPAGSLAQYSWSGRMSVENGKLKSEISGAGISQKCELNKI